MNNIKTRIAVLILFPGLAFLIPAQAQEKQLTKQELPPAVQKTIAEQYQNATIKGYSSEIENGARLYEVELIVNGRHKDISLNKNGNVVEVEEEVTLASLPPEVKSGLLQAAGAGTIEKVESLTKNNRLVAYEASVKKGTKHSEVQVGPTGRPLAHEE